MRQQQSLGQATPVVGSKAFHSLRLWLLMKTLGLSGINEIIERRCEQALRFAALLENYGCFLLLNEVSINSVVFVYFPEDLAPPLTVAQANLLTEINRQIYT